MKYLITGSHGFLGSHLVARLEQMGHTVLRGDREGNIPESVDILIDCATYGNIWGNNDPAGFVMDFKRFMNLHKQRDKYKKAIITSSSSITMKQLTGYAMNKNGMEYVAKCFGEIIIRPYTIYGIGDNPKHLIPTVFRSCLQDEPMELDPEPTHDYIWVEDLVDVYLSPPSKLVEAGTGIATSNKRIVEMIEDITGKKANITKIVKGLRPYDGKEWKAPGPVKQRITHMTNLHEGLGNIYYDIKPRLEATYN